MTQKNVLGHINVKLYSFLWHSGAVAKQTQVESWWQEFPKDGRQAFQSLHGGSKFPRLQDVSVAWVTAGWEHGGTWWSVKPDCEEPGLLHWGAPIPPFLCQRLPGETEQGRLSLQGLLTWFQQKGLWGAGSGDAWPGYKFPCQTSVFSSFYKALAHVSTQEVAGLGGRPGGCCRSSFLVLSERFCLFGNELFRQKDLGLFKETLIKRDANTFQNIVQENFFSS